MDEMEASQEDASEKILNDIQAWNRRPIKASMEGGLDGAFHQVQHAAPQLCCGEWLFSMASDVLRAKRSCLTAENFENLIFMKGTWTSYSSTSCPSKSRRRRR
ncbi:Hypothetical protein FKW44_000451, partial [Caligus rogercresseyi]